MNRRAMRHIAAAVVATAAGLTAATAASADAAQIVDRTASEADGGGDGRHRSMHDGIDSDEMHREMTRGLTDEHRALYDRMHERCSNHQPNDERNLT